MNEAFVVSILIITIRAGISLLYATLGEIFTERSGILNLGVEGIMVMGAATAFAVSYHSDSAWLGALAALLVGALMALLHAFLSITLRADQTVSGLALTIFGTGLASFMGQRLGPGGTTMVGLQGPSFERFPLPLLSKIPYIGMSVFNQDILAYILYLLIPILWFYLYKTQAGLHLRAVGEKPQAADAMGINVARTRYLYTVFGGMLIGLAGAHLSLAYLQGWAENITGGRGWIAIALVIFAMWDPVRAMVGALLFGGINALQFRMQAAGATIPSSFLNMMPYLFTIVVLVLITAYERIGKRIGAPAALGLPFAREEKG
ncbi:MAG: ABC transporter permease [Anaerolineales bacterium]|nr:ABC transporter permease [Anaerolineales bacterium]